MKRLFFLCLGVISFCLPCSAQDNKPLIDALSNKDATTEQWASAIALLVNEKDRVSIQSAVKQRKPFPKNQLVALLKHSNLDVRLGAIELLEDATGGDNGFNAWVKSDSPENKVSIKMWTEWAADEKAVVEKMSTKLSPEKIKSYIQQLLSDDRARISRAVRMLENDNFNAVASIQQFIVDNPTLPLPKVNQLKQAQYELVLIKATRSNAAHLARDLVKGNRDQMLVAIANMKKLGLIAIPIIRDFIDAPDALIRETAIDAILTVGGAQTLPFVEKRLREETDINVIHVAIKNLKDIGGDKALEIIKTYLTNKDEDLVISSIAAITKLIGGADDSFGSSRANIKTKPESLEIMKLLKDSRWRVRVAALEHVSKLKVKEASPQVIKLLKNDKDEFVRFHTIKSAVSLKIPEAKELLNKLYMENDDMIGSLTTAIIEMNGSFPDDLLKHLKTRDPDTIISALKSFNSSEQTLLKTLAIFVKSKNIDVSCAALRIFANDDSKTKQSYVANILSDVIKEGNPKKLEAVINSLDLPTNSRIDPSLKLLKIAPKYRQRASSTTLDPLYNAFLKPGGKALVPEALEGAVGAESSGGLLGLSTNLYNYAKSHKEDDLAFQISLILTKAGDKRGLQLLQDSVAKMPISKRSSLAEALYNPRQKETVPIIKALLQDPSKDIRAKAIKAAFSNDKNKVLIQAGLDAVVAEGTKIEPADVYSYRIESALRSNGGKSICYAWCVDQLKKETIDDQTRILALVLFRRIANSSDQKLISPYTTDENPWIRRAAWYTLGIMRSSWLNENIDKLTKDPHPEVRAALTVFTSRQTTYWKHVFSDVRREPERGYYNSLSSRRINDQLEKALRSMAANDSFEANRFEAMFTLLTHSRDIDLREFINLIPNQHKEAFVIRRLSDHVERNYRSMGKGLRPLLAYVDFKRISRSYHPKIAKHFGTDSKSAKGAGFSTFDGLAKASDVTEEPLHLITPEEEQAKAVERKQLTVIFFEKAGCKKCEQVESYLKDMKRDFPKLVVRKEYVDKNEGILLNTYLSNKLQVPSTQRLKAPALFTSRGFLVGGNIQPEALAQLLEATMATAEQEKWYAFKNEEEKIKAAEETEQVFRDTTLIIVIIGGLIDGINPCAFATIIFFLSYLTIAKRSAKEIFFVGVAFILAIFLSYLSFGLLFNKALHWLTANTGYQWVRSALNYVFAAFALTIAIISLRDWWRARQGRLGDMTLQLPSFLKNKIRGVIRKSSKSSLYVLAAFFSGIIISLLELACTGQVYAPIIYKINQGSGDAVKMLVIYNLAFILPLVIIFGLAMTGMKSSALIDFQKNHTAKIKFMTALLFFALAAVLLFSAQISLWLEKFYPSI